MNLKFAEFLHFYQQCDFFLTFDWLKSSPKFGKSNITSRLVIDSPTNNSPLLTNAEEMVVAKLQELKENQVNVVNVVSLWELQGVTGGGS